MLQIFVKLGHLLLIKCYFCNLYTKS